MPSKSKSQQRAAGMAHAVNKGELDPKTLKGPAKQMYDDMDDEQLRAFAKTKHKGKPEHVEEERVRPPKPLKPKKRDLSNTINQHSKNVVKSRYDERPVKEEAMPHTNIIKGSFTQAQLNVLKAAYEKIDRVDPNSKSYKELIDWLDKMPNAMLKQLERSKIKFLSHLARNRIGMNENINEEVLPSWAKGLLLKKVSVSYDYTDKSDPDAEQIKLTHYTIRNKAGKTVGKMSTDDYFGYIHLELYGKKYDQVDNYKQTRPSKGERKTAQDPKAKLDSFLKSPTGAKWAKNLKIDENFSPIVEETPRGFNMGQKVKSKHMSNTVLTVSEVPRGKDWVYVTDKKGHEMKVKISDLSLAEGYNSGTYAYEKDSADPYPAPKLPAKMAGPDDVEEPNIEDEDPEFGRHQRARLEGKKQKFLPVLDENQDEDTTDEDKIIDPEEAEEELDESLAGDVWKQKMGAGKFEVRGTVGNTSNEKVGAFATKEEAIKVAKKTKNGKVVNMVSNETIYEAYQQQFKPGPPPNQVKRDEKERKTWVVTYVTADRKTKEIKLTARDHHEADMLAHEKLGRDPNVGRITGVKLAEADMAVAGLHKNRSMWEDTEDDSENDGIDSSELIGQEDDTTDGVTEGRYAFKPNQSIKYQSKSWTVKQATKDWVELEDKRGYSTIVDFDDIRDFTDGNLMVERDLQLQREQQERMIKAAGLKGYDNG